MPQEGKNVPGVIRHKFSALSALLMLAEFRLREYAGISYLHKPVKALSVLGVFSPLRSAVMTPDNASSE